MKIDKMVILSTVLLSSIAGAMNRPKKLVVQSLLTLANNPTTTNPTKMPDNCSMGIVTRILADDNISLDEKSRIISVLPNYTQTENGQTIIQAVAKKLATPKQTFFKQNFYKNISLKGLLFSAFQGETFDSNIVKFFINQSDKKHLQDPIFLHAAILHRKEPLKSVQCLLDNGVSPNIKISVKEPDHSSERMFKKVLPSDIAKETLEKAKNLYSSKSPYPSKFYAAPKEYEKTIEILEKAELNETYSGISRLFEEN